MYKLYLKTHNKTGLKYLGYTKNDDVSKYKGSGVYWKHHIKKHGYDVKTTILGKYDSIDELKEMGQYYSEMWNVTESSEFANLKEEAGISGNYSMETRKKMSANHNYEAHQLAWTKERRENQSNLTREKNKILWADSSHKEKRSNAISKALTGRKNGPRSEEFKKIVSEKLTGRSYGKGVKHNLKEVTCPYCNKTGKGPNMTRYHFDKCKEQ